MCPQRTVNFVSSGNTMLRFFGSVLRSDTKVVNDAITASISKIPLTQCCDFCDFPGQRTASNKVPGIVF